jgi:hypothetical protein
VTDVVPFHTQIAELIKTLQEEKENGLEKALKEEIENVLKEKEKFEREPKPEPILHTLEVFESAEKYLKKQLSTLPSFHRFMTQFLSYFSPLLAKQELRDQILDRFTQVRLKLMDTIDGMAQEKKEAGSETPESTPSTPQ